MLASTDCACRQMKKRYASTETQNIHCYFRGCGTADVSIKYCMSSTNLCMLLPLDMRICGFWAECIAMLLCNTRSSNGTI